MFYITIFALPETATIGFDVVIMGFIFGTFAIGFSPGGLGAYPYAIASVFFLYGIPKEIGTAFGYLVWTSQTLLTIVLGILSYIKFKTGKFKYEKHGHIPFNIKSLYKDSQMFDKCKFIYLDLCKALHNFLSFCQQSACF